LEDNGFDARAKEGEKSQFDVIADGRLVFSKQSEGRFPDPEEVLSALRAA